MDKLTKLQRSHNMAQIKSKNTKPELFIFSILDRMNLKYEKHYPIYGKPDVVFLGNKVAVFINGGFWHGRNFKSESYRYTEFWKEKIYKNMVRDRKNYLLLKKDGLIVIKIWDKDPEFCSKAVSKMLS